MIRVTNAVLRHPTFRFRSPVSLTVADGEQIAIVGANGAGKSILAQLLAGACPLREGTVAYDFAPSPVYENIKTIAFRDCYGLDSTSCYLQQRWNSTDSDASPLVRDCLPQTLYSLPSYRLSIDELLDKPVVQLSSGELRKFLIIRCLLGKPRILIIDKPFIGLDAAAIRQFAELLDSLAATNAVQIILLLSKASEIPAFITHVVPVYDMQCGDKVRRSEFRESPVLPPSLASLNPPETEASSSSLPVDRVIEMRDVSLRYGARTIISHLNWTVCRGERWALSGANGSGKSALLSLVCADNPQAYACDISLFGRRRGSGESIWDIKRRIGYVSPEMHRAYMEDIPALKIVASGLYDTVGLYTRLDRKPLDICEWWMKQFDVFHLRDRNFLQLSDGEQRIVLLARAFVKDPELLILDEPLHGLDTANCCRARHIIDLFARRSGKTLVIVTHDEQELPACITHRLVLQK